MNSDLFEEWIYELDCKFQREKRKVALIAENCQCIRMLMI